MLRVLIFVCTLAFWLAPNPVSSAAADPCPGARPITEVRKLPVNSQATVRGLVTVPTGALTDGKSFAVQDAGSGIYVYRSKGIGQELAAGDEVCVTGKLTEYHGLLSCCPPRPRRSCAWARGRPRSPR